MDIKEMIENLVEKIQSNANLKDEFEKEPVKVIEKVLKVDLPDEMIEKVIDGVKAKIAVDKVDNLVEGIAGKLKNLF